MDNSRPGDYSFEVSFFWSMNQNQLFSKEGFDTHDYLIASTNAEEWTSSEDEDGGLAV